MYDSFRKYQTELLAEFERLAKEYNFEIIDATPDLRTVFEHLRAGVARVLSGEPREPLFSVPNPPAEEPLEAAAKRVLEMTAPTRPGASTPEEAPPADQPLARAVDGDATK
jgi:hypothetical protein